VTSFITDGGARVAAVDGLEVGAIMWRVRDLATVGRRVTVRPTTRPDSAARCSVSDGDARSRESKRSRGSFQEEHAGRCQRDICLDDHVEQVIERYAEFTDPDVVLDYLESVTQPSLVKPSALDFRGSHAPQRVIDPTLGSLATTRSCSSRSTLDDGGRTSRRNQGPQSRSRAIAPMRV
jgi:hypothetical protein